MLRFLSIISFTASVTGFTARAIFRVAANVLGIFGLYVLTVVIYWDRTGGGSNISLNDAIRELRHELLPLLLFLIYVAAGIVSLFQPVRWPDRRSSLVNVAREEAAHALAACALGLPLGAASVYLFRHHDARGAVGVRSVRANTNESFYGAHVRMLAVLFAGHVAKRGKADEMSILMSLRGSSDLQKAEQVVWTAAAIHPEVDLFREVMRTVLVDMKGANWKIAVEDAARTLLSNLGRPVHAEEIAQIVARHRLSMRQTEALLAGPAAA